MVKIIICYRKHRENYFYGTFNVARAAARNTNPATGRALVSLGLRPINIFFYPRVASVSPRNIWLRKKLQKTSQHNNNKTLRQLYMCAERVDPENTPL